MKVELKMGFPIAKSRGMKEGIRGSNLKSTSLLASSRPRRRNKILYYGNRNSSCVRVGSQ